jgi:hypothetical protein
VADDAATPIMRLAVETIASLAPSSAARSHPARVLRCTSPPGLEWPPDMRRGHDTSSREGDASMPARRKRDRAMRPRFFGRRSGYAARMERLADAISAEALAALEHARAQGLSYGIRLLASPDGRLLVVLGEAHLKLGEASRTGKELVDAFELRGVEGFPRHKVLAGRALKVLIDAPRALVRALSLGSVKDSTILDARRAGSGFTVPLENASRVPLALHVASVYLTAFFAVGFTLTELSQIQDRIPLVVLAPLLVLGRCSSTTCRR